MLPWVLIHISVIKESNWKPFTHKMYSSNPHIFWGATPQPDTWESKEIEPADLGLPRLSRQIWSLKKSICRLSLSRHIWVRRQQINVRKNSVWGGLFRLRKESWDVEMQQTPGIIVSLPSQTVFSIVSSFQKMVLQGRNLGFFSWDFFRGLVCCKSQNKTNIIPRFYKHEVITMEHSPFVLKWSAFKDF